MFYFDSYFHQFDSLNMWTKHQFKWILSLALDLEITSSDQWSLHEPLAILVKVSATEIYAMMQVVLLC